MSNTLYKASTLSLFILWLFACQFSPSRKEVIPHEDLLVFALDQSKLPEGWALDYTLEDNEFPGTTVASISRGFRYRSFDNRFITHDIIQYSSSETAEEGMKLIVRQRERQDSFLQPSSQFHPDNSNAQQTYIACSSNRLPRVQFCYIIAQYQNMISILAAPVGENGLTFTELEFIATSVDQGFSRR
jgi:hypothetical protein